MVVRKNKNQADITVPKAKDPKLLYKLIVKLVFIIFCIFIVIWQTDINKISYHLINIDPVYFLFSVFFMILAQIFSALRMRYYYLRHGLNLNYKFSIGLYFTSMLYNNILPGGIGGDGYKMYLISKLSNLKKITTFRVTISERANGLFILLLSVIIFVHYSISDEFLPHKGVLLIAMLILLVPAYFLSIKILLKETWQTATRAMIYSTPVQLLNLISCLMLLYATKTTLDSTQILQYLLLFVTSAVASIIPISIGGVGIREVTFLYGGKILGLNIELGIIIGFLFFIVSMLTSLIGLLYWHRINKLY